MRELKSEFQELIDLWNKLLEGSPRRAKKVGGKSDDSRKEPVLRDEAK